MIPSSTENPKARTSDERRIAFVDAARNAFFSGGYGGASMSAISAAVGGSKTTLWTYFPSKQDLFAAVVDDLVERYGRALEVPLDPDEDLVFSLRLFALALLETLHSDPIIDMHRLTIGEAGRFPELGRLMHERGAARGKARLGAFFAEMTARGKLRAGDPMCAAHQFSGMIQSGSVQPHLLGLTDTPSRVELDAEIEDVVQSFLRGWSA